MAKTPTLDPDLLDALAKVFAELALDRMIAEAEAQAKSNADEPQPEETMK
jgi:hypothetical protein